MNPPSHPQARQPLPCTPSLSPGYRPQAGLWPLPCMQHAGWFPQLSLPLLEEDRDLPGAFCLWPIILGPQAASEICSPDGRLYEAQLRLRVPRSAAWGAGRGLGAAQREGLVEGVQSCLNKVIIKTNKVLGLRHNWRTLWPSLPLSGTSRDALNSGLLHVEPVFRGQTISGLKIEPFGFPCLLTVAHSQWHLSGGHGSRRVEQRVCVGRGRRWVNTAQPVGAGTEESAFRCWH